MTSKWFWNRFFPTFQAQAQLVNYIFGRQLYFKMQNKNNSKNSMGFQYSISYLAPVAVPHHISPTVGSLLSRASLAHQAGIPLPLSINRYRCLGSAGPSSGQAYIWFDFFCHKSYFRIIEGIIEEHFRG